VSEIVPLVDAVGSFATFRQAFGVDDDTPWELTFRSFLVRLPAGLVLVDTGVGPSGGDDPFLPERQGRLPDELARAGVAPGDVDLVVLTHLHPDHVGWNMVDGAPFFPNARYVAHRDDYEWIVGRRPDRPYVRDNVVALERTGRLELVVDPVEPLEGVRLLRTGGHTPGHCLVELGDATIAADLAVHELQLADPSLGYVAEEDRETIAGARRRLLPGFATSGRLVAFAHLGVGRVVAGKDGTRFAWQPAD